MTSIQAKITRYTKEENTIHHEKNQSTEKYSYMTDLLDKNIKSFIKILFPMFKKVDGNIKHARWRH